MKVKYKVFLHYLSFVSIGVEAPSEAEAFRKAEQETRSHVQSDEIMSNLGRDKDNDRVYPIKENINYGFAMSRILKPGKIRNWELKFDIIPAGQPIALYDRSGRIIMGECAFDYPLVALVEGDKIWMSDSPLEVESALGAVELAKGSCLVSGLGIGLLPTLIKDEAKTIDIVELNKDVIDLIYPQIQCEKTRIIQDDIFHYLDTTDKKYDFIHIDIWGEITAPILEIEKAREKAVRCLKPGGTTWCWLQELYDRIKDKLPKEPVEPGKFGRHDPCLICGNRLRDDYGGLCATCAEEMGVTKRYL